LFTLFDVNFLYQNNQVKKKNPFALLCVLKSDIYSKQNFMNVMKDNINNL